MAFLQKEKTLIPRDENGNLIPVETILELLDDKPTIKAIPLTKGELQKMFSATDEEKEQISNQIVIKNCIEPKYTEEEIKFLKTDVYGAIIIAILGLSTGMSQEDIKNKTKDIIDEDSKKKVIAENKI